METHRVRSALRRSVAGAALAGLSTLAQAGVFLCIEGAQADCDTATAGLSWTWDGAYFTVDNAGGGYVSEIYFDVAEAMSVAFLTGSTGVSFTAGATPPLLPGGNALGFVADYSFDADGKKGVNHGIGTGEWARFSITPALLDSFDDGALTAGLHLRGLADGGASLLTITAAAPAEAPIAVSEPPMLAMALTGGLLLGWSLRRRGKG